MRLAVNITRGRRKAMNTGFWWKSQKVKDNQEDVDVGGTLLKRVIDK
jgi:hypothetical protein